MRYLRVVIAVVVALIFRSRLTMGGNPMVNKIFESSFVPWDEDWNDRKCLMTLQGQDYVGKTKTAMVLSITDEHRCKNWDDVALDEVSNLQGRSTYLNKEKYPGRNLEANRNWCRNPGGAWEEPSCFVRMLDEAFTCQIPLCPLLQQFRTAHEGEEYGGGLDMRNQTRCSDTCYHRGVRLLGPACTVDVTSYSSTRHHSYSVYYPCQVPLVDGHHVVYGVRLVTQDLPPLVPMTWFLTPSPLTTFPYGDEGRLLFSLPDVGMEKAETVIINFRIRLADAKDIDKFKFFMAFSPDQTFVDMIHLTFTRPGITIGHTQHILRGQKPWDRKVGPEELAWISLMYRWVYLQLVVSATKAEVFYAGGNTPIVTIKSLQSLDIEKFKIPKYVFMASFKGTMMAAIDEVNGEGFHCTEGIVKMPVLSKAWQSTWGMIPTVDPQPGLFPPISGVSAKVYNKIKLFYERKLSVQVFNPPFSLLITSKPILLDEVRGEAGAESNLSHLKVNGVQVIVGKKLIKITKCGLIKFISVRTGEIGCAANSEFIEEIPVSKASVGDNVLVELLASENPAWNTSAEIRIKYGKGTQTVTHLTHPIFPRFWSLTKSKHNKFFKIDDPTHNGHVFFRLLGDRCTPQASNWYSPACLNTQGDERAAGVVTWTRSGRTCMPWNTYANADDNSKPEGVNSKPEYQNTCRNSNDGLWCFVDLNFATEKCYAPACSEVTQKCSSVPGLAERVYVENKRVTGEQKVGKKQPKKARVTDVQLLTSMRPAGMKQVCDDKEETFLVNVMARASPERLTHYVVPGSRGVTQVNFHLRSWERDLGTAGICLYVSDTKKERLKIRITQRTLWHSKSDSRHETTDPTYIVFWRYVKYSLISIKGWWALYQDEKLDPLFKYKTRQTMWKIRFDSCFEKEKSKSPKFVMVKIEPSKRLPFLKQIFTTGYFTSEATKQRYSARYRNSITVPSSPPWLDSKSNEPYVKFRNYDDVVMELESYQRLDQPSFDVWFKGEKDATGTTSRSGGAFLVLLSSLYPRPEVQAMIEIESSMLGVMSRDGQWQRTPHQTFFSDYMSKIQTEITYDSKGSGQRLVVYTTLYPSVNKQSKSISVSVAEMPRYVGFSSHRMKVQWARSMIDPPHDIFSLPRKGGWSDWILQNCTVNCGGGIGNYIRTCTNPLPSTLGQDCRGNYRRKGHACNTHLCGMVSEKIQGMIQHEIISVNKNKYVNMLDKVKLPCKTGRPYRAIIKEYPGAVFFWQHKTGRYFTNNTKKSKGLGGVIGIGSRFAWQVKEVYVDNSTSLVIEKALPEQTGLWLCAAQTGPDVITVVYAIPFVVLPRMETKWVLRGSQVTLACGARDLSKLTGGNIHLAWYHNGSVYWEKKNADTALYDILLIPKVSFRHSGIWECRLQHQQSKIRYNTALYEFVVRPEPKLHITPIQSGMSEQKKNNLLLLLKFVAFLTVLVVLYNVYMGLNASSLSQENDQLEIEIHELRRRIAETKRNSEASEV